MGLNFQELTVPEQVAVWEKWVPWATFLPVKPDARLLERISDLRGNGRRVLEIGPGRGRNLLWLAEHEWRVHAVDWAQSSLTQCKETMDNAGKPVVLAKGDFRRLPFDNATFHLIIAINVLQHCRMHDFQRAMGEIKRTLAIGGTAVISLPTVQNAPAAVAGTWVEKNTLVLVGGPEGGIPHHFFTEEDLQPFMKRFRKAQLDRVVEPYPNGKGPLHDKHVNEWFWLTLVG